MMRIYRNNVRLFEAKEKTNISIILFFQIVINTQSSEINVQKVYRYMLIVFKYFEENVDKYL